MPLWISRASVPWSRATHRILSFRELDMANHPIRPIRPKRQCPGPGGIHGDGHAADGAEAEIARGPGQRSSSYLDYPMGVKRLPRTPFQPLRRFWGTGCGTISAISRPPSSGFLLDP